MSNRSQQRDVEDARVEQCADGFQVVGFARRQQRQQQPEWLGEMCSGFGLRPGYPRPHLPNAWELIAPMSAGWSISSSLSVNLFTLVAAPLRD